MNLIETLSENNIKKVLIIDDGFDHTPLAGDLYSNDSGWDIFFDDCSDHVDFIAQRFPGINEMDASDLKRSDEFVSVLWGLKGSLASGLWDAVFLDYERSLSSDVRFLNDLIVIIQNFGLDVIKSGRNVPTSAYDADVIFADLFLGQNQSDDDIKTTIDEINKILKNRRDNPPLVILMSRSPRLQDKKGQFRDETQMLGTMFRVHNKSDLIEGSRLERVLERLATHYGDGLKMARFISSWERGLDSASKRFLTTMRRLDLSDCAQIQSVLLNFDGQPLGSYLLDVFDCVLQYEIESDKGTIASAEEINSIQSKLYPAPYISGSPDLQEIVNKTIWQNPRRLQVKANSCGAPVNFGDVLIRSILPALAKNAAPAALASILEPLEPAPAPAPAPGPSPEPTPVAVCTFPQNNDAEDALESDVYIVLTPACDLARAGVKTVLLVGGSLVPLSKSSWVYDDKSKTPIYIMDDGNRYLIEWNFKDIQAVSPKKLREICQGHKPAYSVKARLRESYALEIQQKLLSNMGRVGVLTKLPATFSVDVSLYRFDENRALSRIDLPKTQSEGGVCFTGRDEDSKENVKLVLTEDAIDELLEALRKTSKLELFRKAHNALDKLIQNLGVLSIELQKGILAPGFGKSGFQKIKIKIFDENNQLVDYPIGLIARNPDLDPTRPKGIDETLSAFIICINDKD